MFKREEKNTNFKMNFKHSKHCIFFQQFYFPLPHQFSLAIGKGISHNTLQQAHRLYP